MVSMAPVTAARRLPLAMGAPAALQTKRLLLRRPLASDAPAVFARYASDPVVTRFLGWRTHGSVADTQLFLACGDAEWRQTGVGPYLRVVEAQRT